jgi:hypothetical protein
VEDFASGGVSDKITSAITWLGLLSKMTLISEIRASPVCLGRLSIYRVTCCGRVGRTSASARKSPLIVSRMESSLWPPRSRMEYMYDNNDCDPKGLFPR